MAEEVTMEWGPSLIDPYYVQSQDRIHVQPIENTVTVVRKGQTVAQLSIDQAIERLMHLFQLTDKEFLALMDLAIEEAAAPEITGGDIAMSAYREED